MRGLNSIGGWLLAGLLCCSATALSAAQGEDRPLRDEDRADRGELKDDARDHRNTREDQRKLAREIEGRLNNDPLFQGSRISVDLYGGLAIVHGSAANESMVVAVNTKLKHTPGVDVIYNYMTTPITPSEAEALQVTYEDLDRLDDIGVRNNAYVLAQRVEDRFDADTRLDGYDFSVDSYLGLIILHGRVDTLAQAKLARDLAAWTDGVTHVISFIDVAGEPLLAPVTVAPVFERTTAIDVYDPVPVSIEGVEVTTEPCCTEVEVKTVEPCCR